MNTFLRLFSNSLLCRLLLSILYRCILSLYFLCRLRILHLLYRSFACLCLCWLCSILYRSFLLVRILNASLRTDSCAFYCWIGWSYCINWSYLRITHHFARSKNITYWNHYHSCDSCKNELLHNLIYFKLLLFIVIFSVLGFIIDPTIHGCNLHAKR